MTVNNIKTVGFIGLGQMGWPMASRLAAAGFALVVQDADPVRMTDFCKQVNGLIKVAESDSAWAEVDALITMLPNSKIVEKVLLDSGVARQLRPGTLLIDMSSSEPICTRSLATTLRESGLAFIDAPVSGGVKGAVAGTLAVMVGGEVEDLERARDLLDCIGKNIFHVGQAGAGHAAKALNNYVSAATLLITVEALHAAEEFGIDPLMMTDVLNASSGRSNTTENKVKQFMLSGTYGSGFSLKLMAKDVRIAMNLIEAQRQLAPLGRASLTVWEQGASVADAGTDHTEMYALLSGKDKIK